MLNCLKPTDMVYLIKQVSLKDPFQISTKALELSLFDPLSNHITSLKGERPALLVGIRAIWRNQYHGGVLSEWDCSPSLKLEGDVAAKLK